jgi:catechol 2,3-dioxygenase-like lactoylglutathione lyase family enzyme
MIDHVSVCVRDLEQATRFYQAVLGKIGYKQLLLRPGTAGFGKTYPEFWINLRQQMTPIEADSGSHVALRAPTAAAVDAFHAAALAAGGQSDGTPGRRPQYSEGYYAAFIRDADGNRIEAVTFLNQSSTISNR